MKIKLRLSSGDLSFCKHYAAYEVVTKITTSSTIYAITNETGNLDYYFPEQKFKNFLDRMDISFEN